MCKREIKFIKIHDKTDRRINTIYVRQEDLKGPDGATKSLKCKIKKLKIKFFVKFVSGC